MWTFSTWKYIRFHNFASLLENNVVVNKIIELAIVIKSLNCCIFFRKFYWSFNITWYSSITIRFNRWVVRNRLINVRNSSRIANFDVTNTILIASRNFWLFHSTHRMLIFSHRLFKFCLNAINDTITMLFFSSWHVVDNMNNKLFFSSMLIITITRLFFCMIVWMIDFWISRN